MGPRSTVHCSLVSVYIHPIFMYVYIYMRTAYLHTHIYLHAHTHIYCVCHSGRNGWSCKSDPEHQNTNWKKTISGNYDATQGLKQTLLYLEHFLRHLNTLGHTSHFSSMPAKAFHAASFFWSFCLLRPRPESFL